MFNFLLILFISDLNFINYFRLDCFSKSFIEPNIYILDPFFGIISNEKLGLLIYLNKSFPQSKDYETLDPIGICCSELYAFTLYVEELDQMPFVELKLHIY